MRVSAESERNSGMWYSYAHKIHKYTVCILQSTRRTIVLLESMHSCVHNNTSQDAYAYAYCYQLEYQSMHTNSNSTCTSVAIILLVCIICILRARSTMHTVYFSIHTLSTSFLVLVHMHISYYAYQLVAGTSQYYYSRVGVYSYHT